MSSRALPLLTLAAGLAAGLAGGWWLYRPAPLPQERPAPAVRQADGSLLLERKPGAAPAKPAHTIPAGATVERRVSVTVDPAPADVSRETGAQAPDCPPVTVDLSMVRMADDTRRLIASSPDGNVIAGLDAPIEPPLAAPRDPRWTVQAFRAYDWQEQRAAWGGQLSYSRGPFTASAGVVPGLATGWVGVGVGF